MLAEKERHFQPCVASLEALVPPDNFYREVEQKLDLSFVRNLVQECYSSRMGRPSIDPVVFFKLQLIMFFEGIRSERQLMDMVNMRLDCRWFLGYDLNEKVPDHSSLSKIRDRYGLEIFQRFFERIVELCIDAGLVWGREVYFDGTQVEANADLDGLVPRFYWEAKQHTAAIFTAEEFDAETEAEIPGKQPSASKPRGFTEKYDGTRIMSRPKHWYERKADFTVSPTDPDATPMKSSNIAKTGLGYHTHYLVDGGKARIILAALVTPASIMDNTPLLDLLRWTRFRWHIHPEIGVGDSKYGTGAIVTGLEQDGIRAYIPIPNRLEANEFIPPEHFRYDAKQGHYVCPEHHPLYLERRKYTENAVVYQADASICNACPIKTHCTPSNSGRLIQRSIFQEYIERAKNYTRTDAYKKAMRKRQVWVEPRFGELKQWHQGRRFRLRRIQKVNIEGLIKAAGQNIKELLKARQWLRRPDPTDAVALLVPFFDWLKIGLCWPTSLSFR